FLVVGEAREELFASHQPEDTITQEFQAFVGSAASVGARGVGQGGAEQFRLVEAIADSGLAFLEDGTFARLGHGFRGRHKIASGSKNRAIKATVVRQPTTGTVRS